MNINIEHLFQKWGKDNKKIPAANDAIKARVTGSLPAQTEIKPANKFSGGFNLATMAKFAVAGASLVVLLVAISKDANRPQYITESHLAVDNISYGGVIPPSPGMAEAGAGSSGGMAVAQDVATERSAMKSEIYPMPYYNYNSTPATDNREYLKASYYATIKTHHVKEIESQAETLVKKYDGRIDSLSLEEKTGYITFVLPKKSFDAFRNDIGMLVNPRFLSEQVQMQNLLPQKVSIEQQTADTQKSADALQKNRKDLTSSHNSKIADLQRQLASVASNIASIKQQIAANTSTAAQFITELNRLYNEQTRLNRLVADENSQYKYDLSSIDSQIEYAKANLDSLDKQGGVLIDNVETVEGSIAVNYIGYWGMFELYVPFWRSLIYSLIFLTILYFLFGRRRAIEMP